MQAVAMMASGAIKSGLILAAIALGATKASLLIQHLFPSQPMLILLGPVLAAAAVATIFYRQH
ncbi:MAG: hypothetical protein J0I40_05810 [Cellulomonas sp.]|nr:hypothetical protein [Cellulomonas sp.]OJV04561.1 MAG: hypothetical protein BGO20_01975 [Bosea sp. 67-29]